MLQISLKWAILNFSCSGCNTFPSIASWAAFDEQLD
jgi:hypothetical protein